MGSFANTLFVVMLGWLQGITASVWSAFTAENHSSFLAWIGQRWMPIAAVLCIIGLAADLSVYFLRRKKPRPADRFDAYEFDNGQTDPSDDMSDPDFSAEQKMDQDIQASDELSDNHEFHSQESIQDLSAFMTEQEEYKPGNGFTQRNQWVETVDQDLIEPPLITKAGYHVPADSPYRRPIHTSLNQQDHVLKNIETAKEVYPDRNGPVTGTRKRRRMNVGQLFSDPEEEIQEFEAPQRVFDSRKAFHDPVYPRGWKKNEEDGR